MRASARMRRALAGTVAVAVLGGLLGGCGSLTLQGVPLPGGASLGGEPYQVTVQFRDVLDLVPQSSVKVNNVSVGEVTGIDVDPRTWLALVHVKLNRSARLPANAAAQLKQTTLLGEKYVELGPPTDAPATGTLADGATIPVARTNRYPEVEEIFGALSMLLNGGGLSQVRNISIELNKALSGREGDSRALLGDLNTLTTTLEGQKGNITRALDGIDRLSANLADERGNLDKVLTDLEPGLAVLEDQRPQLVGMLHALDKLSDVTNDVVDRSQDDLVADLQALRPTLHELARTGDTLPNSLQILATPPFTDSAVAATKGDFMNLNLKLDLNIQDLLDNLLNATTLPIQANPLTSLPAPVTKRLGELPGPLPQLLGLSGSEGTDKDSDSSDPDPLDGLGLGGLGGNK